MRTPKRYSTAVIDIFPWQNGSGFANADTWWSYVLSQPEADRLDLLIGMALLSQEVCLLLLTHDRELLELFEFAEDTTQLLLEIEAHTLDEFAQAFRLKRSAED